jgi:hypothetical protein
MQKNIKYSQFMVQRLFRLKDVMKMLEETRQRIQYWVVQGMIEPHDPGVGTGTAREFSFRNVVEIAIVSSLSNTTINTSIIKNILLLVRHDVPELFSDSHREPEEMNSHKMLVVGMFGKTGSATISTITTPPGIGDVICGYTAKGATLVLVDLSLLKNRLLAKLSR